MDVSGTKCMRSPAVLLLGVCLMEGWACQRIIAAIAKWNEAMIWSGGNQGSVSMDVRYVAPSVIV